MTLYGQENGCNCGPACAQMILEWYNYLFTQNKLADEMNVEISGMLKCGTTHEEIKQAIERLTRLKADIDDSPTLEEAAYEIELDRPFMSFILKHARVCCGYIHQYRLTQFGGFVYYYYRTQVINDPRPMDENNALGNPHGGRRKYEDWDFIVKTKHMYIRPRFLLTKEDVLPDFG